MAVMGTARDDARWVMAGSPCVRVSPDRRVTPLEGITARAGAAARVAFAQGSFGDAALPPVPTEVLEPAGREGTGLLGEYWTGETSDGDPEVTVVDPTVEIPNAPEGLSGAVWSARWTGTITPTVDGPHRFTVLAAGISRLVIDGVLVASGEREFGQVFDGPPLPVSGMADLRAGHPVSIRLDYNSTTAWPVLEPGVGGGNVQLGWQPPDTRIQEAAQLAADCDVAVVFASHALGEGMDRTSLALPGDQDELIAAVANANPRTAVVLNTGGPVLMPWLDQVGAVVQAWHAGQQLGEAVAAVLFGDADPGGRLPVTFPATPEQGPVTGPERWPGVDGDARYDEGVLVGYRWYDQHGQQPLFPFGHGLSYGEFEYGQPRLQQEEATGAVTVSLGVTNVGGRAGADVVQLYVAVPAAAGQPPRQLKGFAKIQLDPGATTEVSLRLERDDLAVFDEASGEWVVHQGRYDVLVGRSSRDIRGRPGSRWGHGDLEPVSGSWPSFAHPRRPRPPAAPEPEERGRTGRRIRSTVAPGRESTVIVPPWRSVTIRRAMSRPRPVPLPTSLVV